MKDSHEVDLMGQHSEHYRRATRISAAPLKEQQDDLTSTDYTLHATTISHLGYGLGWQ